MKTYSLLLTPLFVLMASTFSQATVLTLNSTTSSGSTVPLGTNVSIYLPTGQAGCSSPTVDSDASWYIYPTPSATFFSGNHQSVTVRWNYYTDAVTVYVTYHCDAVSSAETSNQFHLTVEDISPSAAFDITPQNVCQGGSITFQASNQKHQGYSPYYKFKLDTNGDGVKDEVYGGASPSFTYTLPSTMAGNYVADFYMYSSETGTTIGPIQKSFVITAKANYAVNYNSIGVVCSSNPTAGVSVNVSNVTGNIGNLTYRWFYNGGTSVTTVPYTSYTPAANGADVYCEVASDAWCVNSPATSNHQTINVTTSTIPTVTIVPSTTDVCLGGAIYFKSSQAGTSYKWTLNSTLLSVTASEFYLVTAQTDPSNNTYFTPLSTLYLEVQGVSGGTCLSISTASTSISGSQITFKQPPVATITPVGNVTICSTCTQTINAYPDATYTYFWVKGNAVIPNQTTSVFTTQAQGTYRDGVYWVIAGKNGCTVGSPTLTVTINTLPTVNAGLDQSVSLPLTSASLPGTASDLEGALTYSWTQVGGTPLALQNTNTTTLVVNNLLVGVYTFRLTVTDTNSESKWDEVTLKVYPANNFNMVREEDILVPGITSDAGISALPVASKGQTNSYFDGVGRSTETVNKQSSPQQYDIVQAATYDAYGRENKKYLPYVSTESNGAYKVNAIVSNGQYSGSAQNLYYNNGTTDKVIDDPAPYAETIFEPSPLNRVLKQGSSGTAWQPVGTDPFSVSDNTVKKRQESNGVNEVLQFSYDVASGAVYFSTGSTPKYYEASQLYASRTLDEQNNEVIEYTDKQGRTICRKVQYKTETDNTKRFTSTYYIYDDIGNLAVVLPPEAVSIISGQ